MTLEITCDAEGFKFQIRDRKRSGFQRISNILTVKDGQPCDTEKNQSPRIPHEYE